MTKTKTFIAASAALVASLGAIGSAEAGHKHKWHSGLSLHIGDGFGYRYVDYNPCRYEYRMWRKTGSWFWRNEYFACRGW